MKQYQDKLKKTHTKHAFTLIELLVTITILVILFIVLISSVNNTTDKAKTTGVQNDFRSLQASLKNVAIENDQFNFDLNVLSEKINANSDGELAVFVDGDQLRTHAEDPWGTQYRLLCDKPENTLGRVIITSAGVDQVFDTPDDLNTVLVYKPTDSGNRLFIDDEIEELPDDNIGDEIHTCYYLNANPVAYALATEGNCVTPSVYYYTCDCGKKGSQTFYGDVVPNKHSSNTVPKYVNNGINHTYFEMCTNPGCNAAITEGIDEDHLFDGANCTKCSATRHVCEFTVQTTEKIATEATCTQPATYYKSCEGCGEFSTNPSDVFAGTTLKPHNNVTSLIKEPTCLETGMRRYECQNCDYVEDVSLPASGHAYSRIQEDQYLVVSVATCMSAKTYKMACLYCKEASSITYTVGDIDKDNHIGDISDEQATYASKDDSVHTKTITCSECHRIVGDPTDLPHRWENNTCADCDLHIHNLVNTVDDAYIKISASCTNVAVYYQSCSCGFVSDKTFEYGSMLAHVYTKEIKDAKFLKNAVDCENAETYYKTCACGAIGTDTFTVGVALGHQLTTLDGLTPTCTDIGFTDSIYCTRCDKITALAEIIPALGHRENVVAGVAPTCTTDGLSDYIVCDVCNEVLSTATPLSALGHDLVDIEAVKATCLTNGSAAGQTCNRCDYTIGLDVIPALGHSVVVDAAKAATCTESGLTEGSHCSVCGEVFVYQQVEVAVGHSPMIVPGVEPSCTESGLTSGVVCSVCNEDLNPRQHIPATGHTAVIVDGVAATCTSVGRTAGAHCSTCKEVLTGVSEIAILPHDYEVTIINPSCGISGSILFDCINCSDTYSELLEALEHVDTNEDKKCDICGINLGNEEPETPEIPKVEEEELGANTLKGIYVFNPTLTMQNFGSVGFEFKWNDTQYYGMTILYDSYTLPSGRLTFNFDLNLNKVENPGMNWNDLTSLYTGTQAQPVSWNSFKRAIVIEEAQVVSEEFYNWFIANTKRGIEITGEWQFKNNGEIELPLLTFTEYVDVSYGDDYAKTSQGFYINSEGITFGYLHNQHGEDAVQGSCVYSDSSQSWVDPSYVNLNFGSSIQYVTKDFYEWLVLNTNQSINENCEHVMNSVIIAAATCAKNGVILNTCQLCGCVSYTAIPRLEHTIVISAEVSPTCVEDGYTEEHICSICNIVTIKKQTLKALGHNFETQVTIEPTCTSVGEVVNKCLRCGFVETIILDKQEHVDENEDYICDICGNIITFTFYIDGQPYTARKNMTWGEWCESEYNTLGFENFNNASPLKIDLNAKKVFGISYCQIDNGNIAILRVKSAWLIDKSISYTTASTSTEPVWTYLQILPDGTWLKGNGTYSSEDAVAEALDRGEISLLIKNNVIIRTYEECYYSSKIFVYVEGKWFATRETQPENVLNMVGGSITIGVDLPESTKWYYCDEAGNVIDYTAIATGKVGPTLGFNIHPYVAVFVEEPFVYDYCTTYEWGTKNAIGNVTTYIYDENGNLVNVAISDENGKVPFVVYSPGTYSWEYLGTRILVNIGDLGTLSLVQGYYEDAELYVPSKKVNTLDFYTSDGIYLSTIVTNSDGTFTLSKLTDGEYYAYWGKNKFLLTISSDGNEQGTLRWRTVN